MNRAIVEPLPPFAFRRSPRKRLHIAGNDHRGSSGINIRTDQRRQHVGDRMHRRQQHRHTRAMQRFHDPIELCGTVRQMLHQRRIAGIDRRDIQPLPPLHQPGEVQLPSPNRLWRFASATACRWRKRRCGLLPSTAGAPPATGDNPRAAAQHTSGGYPSRHPLPISGPSRPGRCARPNTPNREQAHHGASGLSCCNSDSSCRLKAENSRSCSASHLRLTIKLGVALTW